MKRYITLFMAFLGGLLLCAACEEKVTEKYEDDACLYFYRGRYGYTGEGQYDSIAYSFYMKESDRARDTVWLDVRLMGLTVPETRSFVIKQANEGEPDAALAGTHYVAFDDPEVKAYFTLPANRASVKVPVIVLRDASLRQKEFRLELALQANQEFGIALPDQSGFLVKLSDRTVMPANWKLWKPYFGEWGPVKMKFIIDYVGFTDFDKYDQLYLDMLYYLQMKANEKLLEYNRQHATVLMEDDQVTKVEFPK